MIRCDVAKSVIGCVGFLMALLGGAGIAFALTPGDIDGSGTVDALDVQLVINGALRIVVPYATDVDYSGSTDALDVQLVINAALHLDMDVNRNGVLDAAEVNLTTSIDTFTINGGASVTDNPLVSLYTACSGGPDEYMVSESPDFTGAQWLPYVSSSTSFSLSPGNGLKTVYCKLRKAILESAAVSASITLELPPPEGPTSAFTTDDLSGTAPYVVHFSNQSTPGDGTISAYAWDFGDAQTSAEENPTHTYLQGGVYTVSLTVTTQYGSDTLVKTGYIAVADPQPLLAYVPAGWFLMGAPGDAPPDMNVATLNLVLQINAQGYGGGDRNGAGSGIGQFGQPATIGNGMLDLAEVGLLEYILAHPAAPYYAQATAAWNRNFSNLKTLATTPGWAGKPFMDAWGSGASGGILFPDMTLHCMAAYATLGHSRDYVSRWLGAFDAGFGGSTATAYYNFATRQVGGLSYDVSLEGSLGVYADSDSDGESNLTEWNGIIGNTAFQDLIWSTKEATIKAYAQVALDGTRKGSEVSLEGESNGYPRHNVYLDAYRIGVYEVTTGEYVEMLNRALAQGKLCVKSGAAYTGGDVFMKDATSETKSIVQITDPDCQVSFSGGQFVVESRNGKSMVDHPMVEVSWYGALAYCNWLSEYKGLTPVYDLSTWKRKTPTPNGYRLPTEAEWERAASWEPRDDGPITVPGGGRGRKWPYAFLGETIDFTRANYNDYYGSGYNNPVGLTSAPYTAPVGYFNGVNPGTALSLSPVGCYDMSGSVWEWCEDWKGDYGAEDQSNPVGPSSGGYFVLRGGGWSFIPDNCRSDFRGWEIPAHTGFNEGFRIAQSMTP